MRRRTFIAGLGAVAWPLAARGQQGERVRRVGVLMFLGVDDPVAQSDVVTFQQVMRELGWTEGRNLTIDYRWAAGNDDRIRSRYAAELVGLAPDVIVASNGGTARIVRQASATVPIVFAISPDPVAAGLVESLARPGGNTTGFALAEYAESGKLLELLREIAPRVTRAAVIRDITPAGTGTFGAIQAVGALMGVEVRPVSASDAGAIERGVAAFAGTANGGLVVPPTAPALIYRELIIKLAARYRLPTVYGDSYSVASGGLVSYGPIRDSYRRVAGYVDRILKGEKPADLPVQAPTRYETVLNLKTAKSLGLTFPLNLLARADEVIE
jgi:putative tryptophan/tyrosine transport system substrate-binding protein